MIIIVTILGLYLNRMIRRQTMGEEWVKNGNAQDPEIRHCDSLSSITEAEIYAFLLHFYPYSYRGISISVTPS